MLSPHPFAALEYWFFKVNASPMALIVDWIVRRRTNELWLRASLHSPDRREVLFDKRPAPILPDHVGINTQQTVGQVGDIRWELDIDYGDEWIAPDIFPARLLRMTDLALVSAPLATFTGQIWQGGQCTELKQSPGLVSHYWGRQLAAEWWWVSANQFDQENIAVECSVSRSGLWGVPVRMPLAYLYLRQADGRTLVISPPAPTQVTGSPEQFEIRFQPLGAAPITLRATGREYGNFGDGIINTLVGDLEIHQGGRPIAQARGTAGLERRAPPLNP